MFRRFRQRIRAIARYRRWPFLFFYADGKTALDPAYPATFELLRDSPRPLLDLGCGMGLLASYLRARGFRAPILGIDADPKKIHVAVQALEGADVRFLEGDAADFPPHHGDVVMLDVLHYFDDEAQSRLLRKIAASIAPGGRAIIRVTLRDATWRFAVTQAEERIIHRIRWIPWAGSNFPTRDEVCAPFVAAGFTADVRPLWGITPFNGYLFTFRRAASPAGFSARPS